MKPNILFLLIDSLRQDMCYGKDKTSITPNLDSIINQGTIFTQAISQASITIPSLSSFFSGKYPFECTTLDNDFFNTIPDLQTYVKELHSSGYSTNAIIPESLNYTNISKFFSNVDLFNSFATLYDGVGEQIIKKINNFESHPWFLYVHLEDLHGHAIFHLKDGPKNFEDKKFGKNQYARMLSAMDPWIGKILDCIAPKNTLVIITADHGSTSADFTEKMHEFSLNSGKIRESENGIIYKYSHKIARNFPSKLTPLKKKLATMYIDSKNKTIEKKLLPKLDEIDSMDLTSYQKRLLKKSVVYPRDCYDENFRPSLIFYGYGVPRQKVFREQVGLIDIFPTIFDLVNLNIQNTNSAKSFSSLFNNEKFDERPLLIDSATRDSESKYGDTIGIRTPKFKYFRDRFNNKKNIHLYDLQKDPFEENNISEENPEIIKKMEMHLTEISPSKNFSFKKTSQLSANDEEKAKEILKKLGYIN